MARFQTSASTWSLEITQNMVDVTSDNSTYNEHWIFIDINGHPHGYEGRGSDRFPTLELVVDESHWCDGTEGLSSHDPHEQIDKSHWECILCRVTVIPKMDPPGTPKSITGRVDYDLIGFRSDGAKVSMWLTPEEAESLKPPTRDGAEFAAQRLLDEAASDRIISITISR